MKFIAQPVKVGDSFYLETIQNKFLIDGGLNRKDILKNLKSNNITNIEVLICTHYDSDHWNGISSILQSQSISTNEIWLPEVIGNISATVLKDIKHLFNILENSERKQRDISPVEILSKEIINEEDNLFQIRINLIDDMILFLKSAISFYPFFRNINRDSDFIFKSIGIIKSALLLTKNVILSGSNVRWLRYRDNFFEEKISSYNMFALNSFEISTSIYNQKELENILYALTQINKESLVFLFKEENYPNILFTADSDLSFTINSINLKDNSIITAPHHGSDQNRLAYSKINGKNLIFVRSDKSQSRRPCSDYVKLREKYCTICRNKTIKTQVELVWSNNNWNTQNALCQC